MGSTATVRRAPARAASPPELGLLPPAEAERWRRRLERTAHPCGCKSGAAASVAALAGTVIWRAVTGFPSSAWPAAVALITTLSVVMAAGVGGKLAGIAITRRYHCRLRRRLLDGTRGLAARA